MVKNRKKYAMKNFLSASLGNVVNSLLTFVSRTIFIYTLGTLYNGINGLYTNVLGMLSLAELGVGAAVSFTLYKPLADNNIKKIQAIMNFYRLAYRLIACVVLVIGLVLVPFLKYIIKGADGVDHLVLYYLIFLFNTVTSYLLIYKATLVEADQKTYLITNINTLIKAIISVAQIIVLLVFRNFLLYLLIRMFVQLLGNVYINYYCNKEYGYLQGKNNEKLSKEERFIILTKIKALMAHKIGEKAVTQTDNIIISSFINVTTVGLVANYTMIISVVNTFIIAFFNSATAAIGNIIATETTSRKHLVSMRYDFLGYIFYGWSTLCLYFLFTPFITLWIGSDKLVSEKICFLLCLNYFLTGLRAPFNNIKSAAGVYEQDKWLPLFQAGVNLSVSIVGAKFYGLVGVYIGTLVSSLIPLIGRPIVVYKYIFDENVLGYFKEMIYRFIQMGVCISVLTVIFSKINISNIILLMAIRLIICSSIMAFTIIIFNFRRDEFRYLVSLVKKCLNNINDNAIKSDYKK